MDRLLSGLDYSGYRGISDQMMVINRSLWKQLYANEVRNGVPELLQLDFEDIARSYLLFLLENDPDAYPVRMVLDRGFRRATLACFDGLVGTWDSRTGKGTSVDP